VFVQLVTENEKKNIFKKLKRADQKTQKTKNLIFSANIASAPYPQLRNNIILKILIL